MHYLFMKVVLCENPGLESQQNNYANMPIFGYFIAVHLIK